MRRRRVGRMRGSVVKRGFVRKWVVDSGHWEGDEVM